MEAFYLQIKAVHVAFAVASGALFFVRGLAFNLLDALWPKAAPIRVASWLIDSGLLTAALMLMTIIQQYPGRDAWLTVKVILVVLYIVVGYGALSPKVDRRRRSGLWLAAAAIFATVVSVARSHDPLGFLSALA